MKLNKTELLAPVGDMVCLHAAVLAGADAVYLGAGSFNARRGAANFDLDTLREACDYAHLRNVKVYLTLNTIVIASELFDALELARQAYRCGVDAFIVQDMGLATEIKRVIPDAVLHASTQMNIHNLAGLDVAAMLGIKKVTLARELSLFEITHLAHHADALGIEIETFVHGALCVCYSGQCFMSSMIGGRSANRGMCAQACRLPYTLHNRALRKTLAAEGEYLLSPKDLNAAELLPQLSQAGVTSFKIEGRMKSAEYVFTVTKIYRAVLDQILYSGGAYVSEEEHFALAEVFSRGFTTAYLEEARGNEIMGYRKPNNRGAFVGRITAVKEGLVSVTFEQEVAKGDVLEFWTNKGHFTHTLEGADLDRGGQLRLRLNKPVGVGDRVFRVRSASAQFADNAYEPAIPLAGKIELKLGNPLRLWFSTITQKGSPKQVYSIQIEGALVEPARTKAVTAKEVEEHIDRLGNTPFCLDSFEVALDEGVGIGFSQLHKIRAQALDLLSEKILESYHQRTLRKVAVRPAKPLAPKKDCAVTAWATNPACARAAKRAGAQVIYVPALHYKRGQALIAGQISGTVESAGYPKQAVMALPVIDHDSFGEEISAQKGRGFDVSSYVKQGKALFVENLGHVYQAYKRQALYEIGPHIPVVNTATLDLCAEMNAQRVWLSPELSLAQIEELGAKTPVPLGLTVAGFQELMTTEHCLLMSQGPCNEDCLTCNRRKSPHYLKDRKGYELPVITDCCGRSHLYNAVPFDVAHAMPDIIRAGVTACMVDTTMMTVAETTKAVERVCRARDIALKSGDKVSKQEGATTGHLFRGVS